MKPALIVNRNKRYESYNEDGRLILTRPTFTECVAFTYRYDYFPINIWSRLGKTIKEKIK